jgi:hypothetical protein
MLPKSYNVGDRVRVTSENFRIMHNRNRSCVTPQYPCDSFLEKLKPFVDSSELATVAHRFLPGYEMSIRFDGGQSFHMKDHWVTEGGK